MIVRIDVHVSDIEGYHYRVSYEGQTLFEADQIRSITACLIEAVQGFDDEMAGAEVAFRTVVAGTYLTSQLRSDAAEIASHAKETSNAIASDEYESSSRPTRSKSI